MANKPRRKRRTQHALEKALINALREEIEINGFQNVKINDILARAEVETNTFYKRFENLDSFITYFVGKMDFWYSEAPKEPNVDEFESFYADTLKKLYLSLEKNVIMQKLLIWELSESNPTTIKTASGREEDFESLCNYLNAYFKGFGVENVCTITALLVGGIYYLTLHKERSTFCGMDYNTRDGKKRLLETLDVLTRAVFSLIDKQKGIEEAIKSEQLEKEIERRAQEKASVIALDKMGEMMQVSIRIMKLKGMSSSEISKELNLPESIVEDIV